MVHTRHRNFIISMSPQHNIYLSYYAEVTGLTKTCQKTQKKRGIKNG